MLVCQGRKVEEEAREDQGRHGQEREDKETWRRYGRHVVAGLVAGRYRSRADKAFYRVRLTVGP